MGSYVFKWPYPAGDVHITGTFDDWGKSIQMNKVGDHWEKEVDLPSADEKVLYKFIVDDQWIVDENAPKEGDGHWNTNNVLMPEQIKRKPKLSSIERVGSVPGAFPETPAYEEPSFSVQPIPGSKTADNPIKLAPGESVPYDKGAAGRTIDSGVTTSKEEYEKADNILPEKETKEATEYSISPLPAFSGADNPVKVPAGGSLPPIGDVTSNTVESGITTSKEDYEKADSVAIPKAEEPMFSAKPLPASSGADNPISIPAGERLPPSKDVTSKTLDSEVTTSKEDYEKADSAAVPEMDSSEQTFSVQPIPGTIGADNPVSIPAGAPVPPAKDVTSKTIDSGITTSKKDYEAADSVAVPEFDDKDQTFSVQPIPGTAGPNNPISLPAGAPVPPVKDVTANTVDSGITTSKKDYEAADSVLPEPEAQEQTFSVKPIPASSGIDNPISLPAGTPIPDQKEITPHTVESTITTSKEDYEKADSSVLPTVAGVTGGALGGAALASMLSSKKDKAPIIPEAGVPLGGEKIDMPAPTPYISSSGPGTTTAELASKVPLEKSIGTPSAGPDAKLASELEIPLKSSPFVSSSATGSTTSALAAKVPVESDPTIRSSGPGTTTAALAASVPLETSGVPSVVKESINSSHVEPEAATSSTVVKEKADVEKELLSKVKTSEAAGEPASAAAKQSSYYGMATSVPDMVEKSMQKAHAPPEAAAESSVVAEKSKMESELLSKIPSTDEAGAPAPTITAATTTTAPTSSSVAATTTGLTNGKTANEVVPDTDTSTTTRGVSAGEIVGGAAVGGAAAASAAALTSKHESADAEPPRVADAQKPDITTESSPAAVTKGLVHDTITTPSATPSSKPEASVAAVHETPAKTAETKDATSLTAAAGVPSLTSAGTVPSKKMETADISPSATPVGQSTPQAPSTPAKVSTLGSGVNTPTSTTASTTTEKRRKRDSLRAFVKKIFD